MLQSWMRLNIAAYVFWLAIVGKTIPTQSKNLKHQAQILNFYQSHKNISKKKGAS